MNSLPQKEKFIAEHIKNLLFLDTISKKLNQAAYECYFNNDKTKENELFALSQKYERLSKKIMTSRELIQNYCYAPQMEKEESVFFN